MRAGLGNLLRLLPMCLAFGANAGEIKGVITDSETKKPVAGAVVTARSSALPEGVNALTEEDGAYSFPNLSAGTYTVSANFAGAKGERTTEVPAVGTVTVAVAVAMSTAQAATYTITGTRIRVPNMTALSPVTSVTAVDIATQGSTSVEDVVNSLPQAFASQGSTISNGSDGTATVNLRGLGNTRNLVLLDGKRLGPGSPTFPFANQVDLNFIPTALVERIDILTGGASAVYGADAVSGVVNFVTKKDFEGVQLDINWDFYQHNQQATHIQDIIRAQSAASARSSDYAVPPDQWNLMGPAFSLLMGVNTPDKKGNVTAYASYRKQNAIIQATRDFSACALNSGDDFTCGGSSNTSPARVFLDRYDANGDFIDGLDLVVQGDTFQPWDASHVYNYGPLNFFKRPDERYNLGAFAHYQLASWAEPYAQVMFMDDDSTAQIAPSGTFFFGGRISCDNPLLSDAQRAVACPAGSTFFEAFPGKRNVEGGPRNSQFQHSSYRVLTGIKGDIGKNWNYDAYMQYMATTFASVGQNDFNTLNIAKALDVVTDPATGLPACQSFVDGTDPTCVPYNIWDESVTPSPEALAYLQAPSMNSGKAVERVIDLNIAGDLGGYGIRSPLACDGIAVSAGGQYRHVHMNTQADYLSLNGFFAGSGGKTTNVDNGFDVWEAFTEIRIPVAQDRIAFQNLALEGAYRYSHYTFGKNTHTFKVGVDWNIWDEFRLRGSYQRAVRAPNIGELYGPQAVLLDGSTDPCALAGSGLAANDPQVLACQASFPGFDPLTIAPNTANQYNGLLGGNPALDPEISDTFAVGFVAEPTFVPGLSVSIDYFNIKVDKAIGIIGADVILSKCLEDPTSPIWCPLVHRDPGNGSLWRGNEGYVEDTTKNLGSLQTSGIDFNVGYLLQLKKLGLENMGTLGLAMNGTWLLTNVTQVLPGDVGFDCTGLFGSKCGGQNSGGINPAWRHKLRLTWDAPFGLSLSSQWRFIAGTDLDVASNQVGLSTPGQVFATDLKMGARHYLDLFASYTFFKNMFTLRFGVNNVIDTDPPLVGGDNCGNAGQCNGNTYPQQYDALGRYFFMSGTAKF